MRPVNGYQAPYNAYQIELHHLTLEQQRNQDLTHILLIDEESIFTPMFPFVPLMKQESQLTLVQQEYSLRR